MGGLNVMKVLGLTLLAAVVLEMLVGLRIVHFKGKLHTTVHRWLAFAILAGALVHAAFGLRWLPPL